MKLRPRIREVGPLAAIFEGSTIYRIIAQDEHNLVLSAVGDDAENRVLPRAVLDEGDFIIEEGYFTPSGRIAGPKSQYRILGEYPVIRQVQAITDLTWAERLRHSRKKHRQPSLEHNALTAWIQQEAPFVQQDLGWLFATVNLEGARILPSARVSDVRRKNRRRLAFDPPGATSLRDNLRKLEANNWNILELIPNTDNCTEGGPSLAPEVKKIVLEVSRNFPTELKLTYAAIRKLARSRINEINQGRPNPLKVPCQQAVTRLAKTIPEVVRAIGRNGLAAARQSLAMVGEGPRYTRLGEHSLIDCWKMQAMSIYEQTGDWDLLTDEVKEIIKPLRLVVARVRESTSGCTLGLAFSLSENVAVVRAALRMAFMDRTEILRYVGAEADPLPPIGLDLIETDGGSPFKSADFWMPAQSLVPHVRKAAGDHPRLRGGVERSFGITDTGYLPLFTGQTGSHVLERGDYDAEGRASLIVDEMAKGLLRWQFDVDHLTKPKAPMEQSHWRKFARIYNNGGFKAPPTADELRKAWGIEIERELGRWGIRYANVMYYRSPRLESFLQNKGPQTVRVKVDPLNIGQISVLVDKKWITVGGPPELDGVGLTEWKNLNRELERRYLEEEEIDWPIIARALKSLQTMSDEAVARAQISDLQITAGKMQKLVNSLKLRILYDDDPKSHRDVPSASSGTVGKTYFPDPDAAKTIVDTSTSRLGESNGEPRSTGLWNLRS